MVLTHRHIPHPSCQTGHRYQQRDGTLHAPHANPSKSDVQDLLVILAQALYREVPAREAEYSEMRERIKRVCNEVPLVTDMADSR
jgi:hypothetical protein